MLPIQDTRISFNGHKWLAQCICKKVVEFAVKDGALKMLARGNCRHCKQDYRSVSEFKHIGIYQNAAGKWCSSCSGCQKEQAYTRKDHAKQSHIADWQCKSCKAKSKCYTENQPVGDKTRTFNRFKKSAENRRLVWSLTEEQMFQSFNGKCAVTDWPISISYNDSSASLDRIDSEQGYIAGNIQWVHKMVNMCKNKYPMADFVKMCNAVTNKVKW